jgi:DNA-binding response OmpR family regulator
MPDSPRLSPRLLVIDDSIADMRVLMGMLTARAYRLSVAFDGHDGYNKAVISPPDLILLDVRMPGMDGFATCRLLKADQRTADIPVIFLTAANEQADRLAGLALGAVDYIVKPFASEEEVLARVGIHLELARRLAQAASAAIPVEVDAGPVLTAEQVLVKAATELLLASLHEPPSAEALARQLGTNEKRLNEAFRKEVSLPVFGWLREQRLRRARQLLAETDTPIADIGAHLGYTNPANFATAFKERFECTPREFRAMVRSEGAREADASLP